MAHQMTGVIEAFFAAVAGGEGIAEFGAEVGFIGTEEGTGADRMFVDCQAV